MRACVCVYVRIHMLVDAGAEENHKNLNTVFRYGMQVANVRSEMTELTERVTGVLFVRRHSRMSYV